MRPFPKVSANRSDLRYAQSEQFDPRCRFYEAESSEPRKTRLGDLSGSAMRPLGRSEHERPKASAGMAASNAAVKQVQGYKKDVCAVCRSLSSRPASCEERMPLVAEATPTKLGGLLGGRRPAHLSE